MHQSYVRPGSAAAAVPAIAATAAEYSSDEKLVERIAAGDKLAMQVLFARHRTNVYRWLFRLVGNETVAEDLLSDVFFDGRLAALKAVPPFRLGCCRSPASRPSRLVAGGPMRSLTRPSKRPWRTVPTTLKWCCRRKAAASSCAKH